MFIDRVSKIYTLRNGNKVYRVSYYTGVETVYYWVAEKANGEKISTTCGTYEKAYELAK